jgi:hypothetical protein
MNGYGFAAVCVFCFTVIIVALVISAHHSDWSKRQWPPSSD